MDDRDKSPQLVMSQFVSRRLSGKIVRFADCHGASHIYPGAECTFLMQLLIRPGSPHITFGAPA